MRVVIRGHEICGVVGDLAAEFSRRGDEVLSIALPHRFFPSRFDYDPYTLIPQTLTRVLKWPRAADVANKALWETSSRGYGAVELAIEQRLLRKADLVINVWAGLPREEPLFAALRRQGTRIASFLMGSDVRDYDVFARQYDVAAWTFPAEYFRVPLAEKLATLRRHERYADALFSVPDQMGLAVRPYHHLQVPLVLSRLRHVVPGRTRPRVLHAPSVPHVKGTDIIERTLERLHNEGVDFEFVSVRDLPHEEVLRRLTESDVLVDELVGHGPGWLSFEAMASGCAVATRYLTDSPPCFRPPVVPIDRHNIYDRLRTLLTDRDLRVRLAEEGRRYVETNNSIERVVDRLFVRTMDSETETPDYVPQYLTTALVPASDEEARTINAANALVADQPWYRTHVAGRSHHGLVF
jgi:glycosyltransferase involved in cell wall biosynthesis